MLWGKVPIQDDPIHLRCDSSLATNKVTTWVFFFMNYEQRRKGWTNRCLPLVPLAQFLFSLIAFNPLLLHFPSSTIPARSKKRETTQRHRFICIKSLGSDYKQNILMQHTSKIHKYVGETQIVLLIKQESSGGDTTDVLIQHQPPSKGIPSSPPSKQITQ